MGGLLKIGLKVGIITVNIMINRCKDCPNTTRCTDLCKEAKWYSDQSQDKWRRGEQRKLIFLDMDMFPDENWADGFGETTTVMETVMGNLTLRQQEVLNLILERYSKTKIEGILNISRWSLNHEIRMIKTIIEKSYD